MLGFERDFTRTTNKKKGTWKMTLTTPQKTNHGDRNMSVSFTQIIFTMTDRNGHTIIDQCTKASLPGSQLCESTELEEMYNMGYPIFSPHTVKIMMIVTLSSKERQQKNFETCLRKFYEDNFQDTEKYDLIKNENFLKCSRSVQSQLIKIASLESKKDPTIRSGDNVRVLCGLKRGLVGEVKSTHNTERDGVWAVVILQDESRISCPTDHLMVIK